MDLHPINHDKKYNNIMKGRNMYKLLLKKQKLVEVTEKLLKGLTKKDRGGKEIIAEIGLVVVAVTLLLIFRTQISSIISTIMSKASTEIDALFS